MKNPKQSDVYLEEYWIEQERIRKIKEAKEKAIRDAEEEARRSRSRLEEEEERRQRSSCNEEEWYQASYGKSCVKWEAHQSSGLQFLRLQGEWESTIKNVWRVANQIQEPRRYE